MRKLILLLLISSILHARQITSIQSGELSNPENWSETPNFSFDTLVIDAADTIYLDTLLDFNTILIKGRFVNKVDQKISINQLIIDSLGSFNNQQNGNLELIAFENEGQANFGDANIHFQQGQLKSKNLISLQSIELTGNLEIEGEVEIIGQIETENDTILLSENTSIQLGGTASEIEHALIYANALNNTIILNRNSYQSLPKILAAQNAKIHLKNNGKVFLHHELSASNIIVDSSAHLIADLTNFDCDSLEINGIFQPTFTDSIQFLDFSSRTEIQTFLNTEIIINSNNSFVLPSLDYSLLTIEPEESIVVELLSEVYNFQNGLLVNGNVKFKGSQSTMQIRNELSGVIEHIDSSTVHHYTGLENSSIHCIQCASITLESCHEVNFYRTLNTKKVTVNNSSVSTGSLLLDSLLLDSLSTFSTNGSSIDIAAVINFGHIHFEGNGENRIGRISNYGHLSNQTSDFIITGNIKNDGTIAGGTSAAAEWKLEHPVTFSGNGSATYPILNTDTILQNHSNITITDGLIGTGQIKNFEQLETKASRAQTEITIQNHPESTLTFSRENFQEIPIEKLSNIHHIIIRGPNIQTSDSIEITGNMNISQNAQLDLNSYSIQGGEESWLMLEDSSTLIIGDNEIDQTNPPIFLSPYRTQLDTNSTIILKSKGNKSIPNWEYGNLIIDDGAIDSSIVTFINDTLTIAGDLELEESSITLKLSEQTLLLNGDYIGPGHLELVRSDWVHRGSNNNSGGIHCEDCLYYLKGPNDQYIKNGDWEEVIVNKSNGRAITDAHESLFRADYLLVENGELALSSEEVHIDSLRLKGTLSIQSARQDKFFGSIFIEPSGRMITDRNETLTIHKGLENYGEIEFGRGNLKLSGNNTFLINHGNEAEIKAVVTDSAALLSGDFNISGLTLNDSLFLDNAHIQHTGTTLEGESFIHGNENSKIQSKIEAVANETSPTFSNRISFTSNITQEFDFTIHFIPSNNLLNEEAKGYILTPENPAPFQVHVSSSEQKNVFTAFAGLNEFQLADSIFTVYESSVNVKFASDHLGPLTLNRLGIDFEKGNLLFNYQGETIKKAYLLDIANLDTVIVFERLPTDLAFYQMGTFQLVVETISGAIVNSNILNINSSNDLESKIKVNESYNRVIIYDLSGRKIKEGNATTPSKVIKGIDGPIVIEVQNGSQTIREKRFIISSK